MRTRQATPAELREGDRTVERRGWAPGPGMILGLLGTAGVVLSVFLAWNSATNAKPHNIPLAFLWDHARVSGRPSLLIALVPIAVVLLVGSLLPGGAPARFVAGAAGVAVAALFAWQLHKAGTRLGTNLDTGWYIGALGSLFGLVSGIVPTGLATRRIVDRGSYDTSYDSRYDSRYDAEDRAVEDVRGDRDVAGQRRHFWSR